MIIYAKQTRKKMLVYYFSIVRLRYYTYTRVYLVNNNNNSDIGSMFVLVQTK